MVSLIISIENDMTDLKTEKDKEIAYLTTEISAKSAKIEILENFRIQMDKYKETIKQLENELKAEKNDKVDQMRNNAIELDLCKNKYKETMDNKLKKAKEMLKETSGKETDSAIRLMLLQNKQLTIELEYQSKQSEKLLIRNKNMEDKLSELKRDIEIHKELV